PEHLERTAVVVQVYACNRRDEPVRHHRGQAPREKRVVPAPPPAADDVLAGVDELDHGRDIARIVLQVAVGGRDEAAARVIEPGGERGRLPEVAAEADDTHARILRLLPGHDLEAV